MNDIKTAYSLGSEGMLITRYTEDASFHEVETKNYHEVIKDMDAGVYNGDLNLACWLIVLVGFVGYFAWEEGKHNGR